MIVGVYYHIFVGNLILVHSGEAASPVSETPHDWLQAQDSTWK